MKSLQIRNTSTSSTTSVSNTFIDTYMPNANGEFLKVYFYLLRNLNTDTLTIPNIADQLHHTESDVTRALLYWQKEHIIMLDFDEEKNITGIEMLPLIHKEEQITMKSVEIQTPQLTKTTYTPKELSILFEKQNMNGVICEAGMALDKALSIQELNTIQFFYEQLHFTPELIAYLINYCTKLNKKSMAYIEKVANTWHENRITTVEEAIAFLSPSKRATRKESGHSAEKNRFLKFEQRSYDYDSITEQLIEKANTTKGV
ncbi:MAG: DnaD domain protein [Lachnospiraceae bacterium]